MLKYTNEEIMQKLNIDKIVKTREVFCSCNSNKVERLYTDVDTKKKTAYNKKKKQIEAINEYTDIDIDYCKECNRVDYITAEQGFADSYKLYFKKDCIPHCNCGKGNIDNEEGYVIIEGVHENGDMVLRNRHCLNEMLLETRGLFANSDDFLDWLNQVAEVKVNQKEMAFYKEQQKIKQQWEELARNNDMNIYTVDDLEEEVNKTKIGRNDE